MFTLSDVAITQCTYIYICMYWCTHATNCTAAALQYNALCTTLHRASCTKEIYWNNKKIQHFDICQRLFQGFYQLLSCHWAVAKALWSAFFTTHTLSSLRLYRESVELLRLRIFAQLLSSCSVSKSETVLTWRTATTRELKITSLLCDFITLNSYTWRLCEIMGMIQMHKSSGNGTQLLCASALSNWTQKKTNKKLRPQTKKGQLGTRRSRRRWRRQQQTYTLIHSRANAEYWIAAKFIKSQLSAVRHPTNKATQKSHTNA